MLDHEQGQFKFWIAWIARQHSNWCDKVMTACAYSVKPRTRYRNSVICLTPEYLANRLLFIILYAIR